MSQSLSQSVSLCVIKSNIALSCPVFLGEQRTSTLVYEVLVLLQYGFWKVLTVITVKSGRLYSLFLYIS